MKALLEKMKGGKEEIILRVGLSFVLLYAGFNSLSNPENWIGFVPDFVELIMNKKTFLAMHGVGEIIIGIGLLSRMWLPLFSGLASLNIFAILLFFGVNDITFRDVGLFSAAIALFTFSLNKRQSSSVVEQTLRKGKVGGSTPLSGS